MEGTGGSFRPGREVIRDYWNIFARKISSLQGLERKRLSCFKAVKTLEMVMQMLGSFAEFERDYPSKRRKANAVGTGQISQASVDLSYTFIFVLCSLLHSHVVPAHQG